MAETKEPDNSKPFALVTGASQGLGKAIALELAKRRIHLLLTALPGEGLENLAAELTRFGIEVHFFETDLCQKENVLRLAAWANENLNLLILVNNAGRGGTRRFLDADTPYLDDLLQLNVRAVSLLTHQLLPNLLRQDKAYILNVSSMAAFSPMGFKTVYPATKKFVQYFSLGLREELKGTNVSVSVLYPGPMLTNEDARRRIARQGRFIQAGSLLPEAVAIVAVRQMFRRKISILAGRLNWFSFLLLSVMPACWKAGWVTKKIRRELKG